MKTYSILALVLFCFGCGDTVQDEQSGRSWTFNGRSNVTATNNNGATTQTNNGTTNNGRSNGRTTASGTTNIGTNNGTTTNSENKCPVAEGREENGTLWETSLRVGITTTINLRNRTMVDGTMERYQWLIVSQPALSTSRIIEDTSEFPRLHLDVVGNYVVELSVFDAEGEERCTPTRVTIRTIISDDFSVQLTWDTPGDVDQTDENGTDLDLHYLHPHGSWNREPFDIFFNNKTSDWGAIGPGDDPKLTIDDVNGAGPEVIVHSDPESDTTYSIGVHYYSDRSFGPTHATVRMYLDGLLSAEFKDEYLSGTGIFWYVATLSWPSKQISGVGHVRVGFP